MLQIKCFVFGPFQTNCYVISDEQSPANVLLVDPACSNEYERRELMNYIDSVFSVQDSVFRNQDSVFRIIATHGHLDHLWGAKWAAEQWQTPVLMHEADIPLAQAMQGQYDLFGVHRTAEQFPIVPLTACKPASPHSLPAGLQILHTPGHTPGSVCLYWPEEKVLLSGDTLFRMGYGRTDLPGGSMSQLITSLEQVLALPADTRVYPGHGDRTTIAAERR